MQQNLSRRLARWSAVPLLGLALAGCDTMGIANSVIGGATQGVVPGGVALPTGAAGNQAAQQTGNQILNSVLQNAPK